MGWKLKSLKLGLVLSCHVMPCNLFCSALLCSAVHSMGCGVRYKCPITHTDLLQNSFRVNFIVQISMHHWSTAYSQWHSDSSITLSFRWFAIFAIKFFLFIIALSRAHRHTNSFTACVCVCERDTATVSSKYTHHIGHTNILSLYWM